MATISRFKRKYTGGYKTTAMLPDHALTFKRNQAHTGSDILHAPPDKAAEIINRILAGKDTFVG